MVADGKVRACESLYACVHAHICARARVRACACARARACFYECRQVVSSCLKAERRLALLFLFAQSAAQHSGKIATACGLDAERRRLAHLPIQRDPCGHSRWVLPANLIVSPRVDAAATLDCEVPVRRAQAFNSRSVPA